MTAALISPTRYDTTPAQPATDVIKLPTLKVFEGSGWHLCHHPQCHDKGLQPVQFYAIFGSHWRYYCGEEHVPKRLTGDIVKPTRRRSPNPPRTPRRLSGPTKAAHCETEIIKALQDGPQAKQLICAGIEASMTRIDTVLRRLYQTGTLTRIALGRRNTHLWYALAEHHEQLVGMVDALKKQIPVGAQRQTILDALQDGPKTAERLTEITGFSIHKVMYTTQALHRLDRIVSITSYADLNWFALPEHHAELIACAWRASTDYRVIQYVESHPYSHTRRIADTLGISFVRAKRILVFAESFGRVHRKTSTNRHTSWSMNDSTSADEPINLGIA